MTTIDEKLMAEHRALNPLYEGVPEAPLPRYPERDKDFTLWPWEHWEKQQAEAVAWVGDLEDEKYG